MIDCNIEDFEKSAARMTDEESAQYEANFIASALEAKAKAEAEWQRLGNVYAFVQPEPYWISFADWSIYANIEDPKVPCDRVIRLDLIGGGQIKVVEKFRKLHFKDNTYIITSSKPELHVTAHCEAGIKRAHGAFTYANLRGCSEMNCYAVVFLPGTDQAIVDRVAATFKAISDVAENFYAMLVSGLHCAFCNRPLRDELSRLIGAGPDCARQYHVPHSHAAAEKRLELRRKLLGNVERN